MSELGWAGTRATLLIVGLQGSLIGQVPTPPREQVARLERLWRAAAVTSTTRDSVARVGMLIQLDTLRVADLVVLSPPGALAMATRALQDAWPSVAATFGDAAVRLRHHPFALYPSDSGSPPSHGFPADAIAVPITAETNDAILTAQLLIAIRRAMRKEYDTGLADWLSTSIEATRSDSAYPAAYTDLATSPSFLSRGCLVGELAACSAALELVPPHDRATEWYDATTRPQIVSRLREAGARTGDLYNIRKCLNDHLDNACLSDLRHRNPRDIPPPLPPPSRERIVHTALALGGPQAFNRLLASAGRPMAERLARTAGVRLDSVIARWRYRTLSAHPVSVDLDPDTGWVALGWGVFFAVLILWSSRWRS